MQFLTQMLHVAEQLLVRAMQWLQITFNALQASPHRLTIYVAAAAVALLLISVPLFRFFGRRRNRRNDEKDATEVRSYSVLGIGPSLVPNAARPAPEFPRWVEVARVSKPDPVSPASQSVSNVTPIHPSSSALCTHCGAALSARQDFCPACGYAQPTQQSVAGFPA
jgi:zinc-ribbon domain